MKKAGRKSKKANAAWHQYKTVYRHSNHHSSKKNSSSSDISITKVFFEYYCYKSTEYYVADCKFQTASKDYIRNLCLKKKKKKTNSKPSRTTDRIKEKKHYSVGRIKSIKTFERKKHKYITANQSNDNFEDNTEIELFSENDSKKKTKSDKTEKVIFIKEEISKNTPANWALDTGASLSITDQFDLYKKESLKSSYKVFI